MHQCELRCVRFVGWHGTKDSEQGISRFQSVGILHGGVAVSVLGRALKV